MEKTNSTNRNIVVKRHQRLVRFIVYSIPLILLLEWLNQFELIPSSPPLILKGISLIVFIKFLITKSFKINSFSFRKPLIFFLIINLIYSFFSNEIMENLYYTVRIFYWILGTITFYGLYKREYLSVGDLKSMIKSVVVIGSFFTIVLLLSLSEKGEYDNGSAYLLLWCMPLMLLFGYSKVNRLITLLAFVAIFITVKRGAMIASVVAFYLYVLSLLYITKTIKKRTRVILFGGLFTIIIAFVAVLKWDTISNRFNDDTGSGRDVMYKNILDHYSSGSPQNLVFGYGLNSAQEFNKKFYNGIRQDNKIGVAAHSDWLQYLHDFGLFGFFFMLVLHIKFLSIVRFNYKIKSFIFPVAIAAYSIFFLTTIYSFILNTPNAFYFGMVIAVLEIESHRIKNSQVI